MDFDTTRSNRGGGSRRRSGSVPDLSTEKADRPSSEDGSFRIPAGSRKAALVHLALEAWRAGLLDPGALGEVRGRKVDEAGLRRALYRSSMGEIEHALGPIVRGRRVVVEGRLAGTGRTALERLGAEVEELRLQDERRYLDMTPAIFVLAAIAMAARYVSLGLDDQDLYILAGIVFALMYGLRPFFFKMQRPKDQ
ncbi:MAG TPA: hypothetical protein VHH10_10235 [Rubrobacteraceae bacterium]|nr:hypothetical protein [Rubrobacteraceae bacterium]